MNAYGKTAAQYMPQFYVGNIGIFLKEEDCYIKELGADRLISHNPDKDRYPDVQADEDIWTVRKVIILYIIMIGCLKTSISNHPGNMEKPYQVKQIREYHLGL